MPDLPFTSREIAAVLLSHWKVSDRLASALLESVYSTKPASPKFPMEQLVQDREVLTRNNDTAAAAAIGYAAAVSQQTVQRIEDGVPFIVDARGGIVTLEHLLLNPLRITASPSFETLGDFLKYVNRFKEPASTVFAATSDRGAKFTAELDYHSPGQGTRNKHSASITLKTTPEWDELANTPRFDQAGLAEFIEDREQIFLEPDAASMLELATTLTATKRTDFKGGVKLQNGSRKLHFTEVVDGQAGAKGEMDIPVFIMVNIPVFKGRDPQPVKVLLKYRLEGGIYFTLKIDRPDLVIRKVVEESIAEIEKSSDLTVLRGEA